MPDFFRDSSRIFGLPRLAFSARAPFVRDPSRMFGLSGLCFPKETLCLGDPSHILLPVQALLPQDWISLRQVGQVGQHEDIPATVEVRQQADT